MTLAGSADLAEGSLARRAQKPGAELHLPRLVLLDHSTQIREYLPCDLFGRSAITDQAADNPRHIGGEADVEEVKRLQVATLCGGDRFSDKPALASRFGRGAPPCA